MLLTFYKTVFQNKVLHKDIDEPLQGKQMTRILNFFQISDDRRAGDN